MYVNPNNGFIALMSAVIISAVLLLVVISGGLTGFFSRSNVLDSELKSRSRAVADACLEQALLLIANNPAYVEDEYQKFNDLDGCYLDVNDSSGIKQILIQGSSTRAVTNLDVRYDHLADPPSFVSIEEKGVY